MTPAVALLNELERRGVEFCAAGDRLRYRPIKAVSPEFLSRLRKHKAELLTILRRRHGTADGDGTTGSRPKSGVLSPTMADRAKADRLGVHNVPFPTNPVSAEAGCRWLEGPALDRLPERVQGCVVAREGWTPTRWADYLRHRARICDERHRDVAKLYEQAVALLRRGSDGDAD